MGDAYSGWSLYYKRFSRRKDTRFVLGKFLEVCDERRLQLVVGNGTLFA